jgi:hypothetical protein
LIGLAIGILVFVISGGHILFLPLLFLPLGLFGFGHRRQRFERRRGLAVATPR